MDGTLLQRRDKARMQAYLAIKYHEDCSNRDRIERITSALADAGVDTVCIARDVERWGEVMLGARALMQVSFEVIETCDLVVVDLTEKGVGIGIEAGYAYAHGIPIVTIAEAAAQGEPVTDISATLAGISASTGFYLNEDELTDILKAACVRLTPS